MPSRLCPLCGQDGHAVTTVHRQAGWEIKRCACGMVYLGNPEANPEASHDLAADNHRSARVHGRLLGMVNRHVRPGNVLEIGCGEGEFLQRLAPQHIPFGIEISRVLSPVADAMARERGGWVVHAEAADGLSMFGEEHFSGVVMNSFLEHVIDPLALLSRCFRHLDAEGRLLIRVPNYACLRRRWQGVRWSGFRFPVHVNYFTPGTLVTACRKSGLRILRFGWRDRHPFSDDLWLVAGKGS